MKNKNGFLLAEETLKIIIAVICLGFLVYFLVALYFNNQNSADLELAKSSLNYLTESINSNAKEAEVYNPTSIKKWYIVSWPSKDKNQNVVKPNYCSNLGWDNCICICKNGGGSTMGLSFTPQGFAEDCDNLGVCMETKNKVIVGESETLQQPINIANHPLKLKIDTNEGKTVISEVK